MTVRVLVADDHPAFRAGLQLMLAAADDIEVVGMAEDGAQVIDLVAQVQPDVVVMDLRMPGLDGIEATRRLLATRPDLGVVVLTMFEDDESVFAAMRAGARGYLLKGAEQDEILRGIRAIAEKLTLSPKTVRNHVSNIFGKLQVAGRAEAIIRARRWYGWLIAIERIMANPLHKVWLEAVEQVMPFREPYNFRMQDIEDQVLKPGFDALWKGEQTPSGPYMKQMNDQVQRILDQPRGA